MVCIAQYLTDWFLPYNDMKELFEFWLLFCLSAELISSYVFAFPITDEIHYSFLSHLIFLILNYYPTFIPDIFNFCFLEKFPNNLCSGLFFGFLSICSPFCSLLSVSQSIHIPHIYSTEDRHTKL